MQHGDPAIAHHVLYLLYHVGLRMLDLGKIGYLVVALFLATWAVSLVYWKARRVEERWTA